MKTATMYRRMGQAEDPFLNMGRLVFTELTFYEKASRRALTTPIGVKLGKKKNTNLHSESNGTVRDS